MAEINKKEKDEKRESGSIEGQGNFMVQKDGQSLAAQPIYPTSKTIFEGLT